MLCIVRVAADLPEVRLEGLLAERRVLLRQERCLVGTQRAQVLRAERYCLRYRLEAYADQRFVRARRSGAFVRIRLADIQSLTIRVRSRCHAVGTDQVRAVVVTFCFLRFCQCSGYRINTGRKSCYCHSLLAMTRPGIHPRRKPLLPKAEGRSASCPRSSVGLSLR